ncbi:hypothetical protein GJ744_010117 [Endocarpon pusillum]|uniref:Uncharacterized protein n=1 Tax=Endocarpon pusillum TaxID=364733 RepID=A0A8H7AIS9_9EURO|nr:hypothetical protein GJ744_010117 [Endocarpon pusillum]
MKDDDEYDEQILHRFESGKFSQTADCVPDTVPLFGNEHEQSKRIGKSLPDRLGRRGLERDRHSSSFPVHTCFILGKWRWQALA